MIKLNIFLLLMASISVFVGREQPGMINDFSRYFVKKDVIKINFTNKNKITPNIVRIFQDSTILIADKEEKLVCRYDFKGKLLSQFNIQNKLGHIDDVIVDSLGIFYIIDGYKNILKKFDRSGKELKTIHVKNGQHLYLTKNGQLLIYNVYYRDGVKNKPIIHRYTLDGRFIYSFGREPKKPNIGIIHMSAGNVSFRNSDIIVCHASDYIMDVYDQNGKLIKTYDRKPSFYHMPEAITSLDKKEMKKWNSTVQLWSSYSLFDDYIISYFDRVDETKHWLFIQNDKRSLELSLPTTLYPIGVNNKKVFFIDTAKNKNNENSIAIVNYEFKSHLLR